MNVLLACDVQIEVTVTGAAAASEPGLEAEAFEPVSFVGRAAWSSDGAKDADLVLPWG